MSIIRAARPTDHFLLIRNDVARDERLSYRARGLLAAILSRPDDWRTSARQLAREGPDGEHAVLGALRELEALGYVERHRSRGKTGRWQHELIVYDHPGDAPPLPLEAAAELGHMHPERAALPGPDNPGAVDPAPVPPVPENPRLEEQPTTNYRYELEPRAPRKRDEIWDTLEGLFGVVTNASSRGARNAAVKALRESGAEPTEIAVRVSRWPEHFGDATLTPTALAKHWDALGRPPARASRGETRLAEAAEQLDRFRNGGPP